MKKTTRKLTLSTETVRVLQSEQLSGVGGGTAYSAACVIGPVTTTIPASRVAGGCKTFDTVVCNFNSLACNYGF